MNLAPAADDRAERLTHREVAILERVADGATNAMIARMLGISPRTVQTHLANAFVKLGARTRAQAVARYIQRSSFSLVLGLGLPIALNIDWLLSS